MRMLVLKLIIICLVPVGKQFVAGDDSSSSEEDSSCTHFVLKPCPCLTENPCEIDYTSMGSIERKEIRSDKDIRNNIRSDSPTELDLSGQNIEIIERNAFENFTELTNLNLANNRISNLPEFVFSKLTNLEHLSLADNDIKDTKNVFAGLKNLKSLDISNNPMTDTLDDNCFFGLTKSCDILMKGVSGVEKIGTNAFGNNSSTPNQHITKKSSNDEESKPKSIHTRSAPLNTNYPSDDEISSDNFNPQVCLNETSVQRLNVSKMGDNTRGGCIEVEFKYRTLFITDFGIIKFEKGWYDLQDKSKVPSTLSAINLSRNNIVRVTNDVVNELPEYITWLDMYNNKIERLQKGTFQHNAIFSLGLGDNMIAEIEDNAFEMGKLYQLFLKGNRLKDTKFAATLPSSLVSLDLSNNEISEISPKSFSNLKNLSYLSLSSNKITTIPSMSLRGATLTQFILSHNKITTIEPGAFHGLTIFQLFLDYNNISSIKKGVFTDLKNLKQLNIAHNNLMKIENEILDLSALNLLQLNNNNITVIEKGAMKKLHNLKRLDISRNPIKRLENGALYGLKKTQGTFVEVTETPIEVIQGGLFDDVS